MNYNIIEKGTGKYIELISVQAPLSTEQDGLDLIALCFENNADFIILHSETLSEDFFKLSTGLAGKILQKLVNYRIKTAIIMENERFVKGRFKELLAESNKGNDFRVFHTTAEAENWYIDTMK